MSFFLSDALAEGAAPAAQDPGLAGLIIPISIFFFFFVLFIWPQHKRTRELKKLVESLTKGNEVVTTGGLLGRIAEVDDSFVQLEVADNVVINVRKADVAQLMPKGTYKARKKTDK